MFERWHGPIRVLLSALVWLGLGAATLGSIAAQGPSTVIRLLVADGETGELRVVDAGSGEVIAQFSTPAACSSPSLPPRVAATSWPIIATAIRSPSSTPA